MILLAILYSPQISPIVANRHETTSTTDMSHVSNIGSSSSIEVHRFFSYVFCFAEVVEFNWFVAEEFFEDEGVLELSTHSSPATPATSDIYSIVDETELLVRSLPVKIIAVLFSVLYDIINNFGRCTRNFDRVCFDVDNLKSPILHFVL